MFPTKKSLRRRQNSLLGTEVRQLPFQLPFLDGQDGGM